MDRVPESHVASTPSEPVGEPSTTCSVLRELGSDEAPCRGVSPREECWCGAWCGEGTHDVAVR